MKLASLDQFISANQELRRFFRKANDFAAGTVTLDEIELTTILARFLSLAPELEDSYRGDLIEECLQNTIAEYIENLKAFQKTVEQIRRIMLNRSVRLEATKNHLDGLQGWVHAYRQTT